MKSAIHKLTLPTLDDFTSLFEKMHTGLKAWFEAFDFQQVGENGRYYFMELRL